MGLLAPLGLGLLLLLIPVIAMYLLKRRREEVVISSTYLWERVIQDMEANAPWQRLRRNLLLLLQLLALLSLIFAVSRPFLRTVGATGQNLIVVLDSSASMAATDGQGGGTRLDAARRTAITLLEGLPPEGRLSLIRAGAGAEVLVGGTRDRAVIEQALATVQPRAADSDISAALSLAAAAAARQPQSEIILLSDGAVTAASAARLNTPVRYLPVGQQANNQAITALNLRTQGLAYNLFVQVTNYGPDPVTRRLLIEGQAAGSQDPAYTTAFDLPLAPGERAERIVEDLPPTVTAIHATLSGSDLLSADDSAWAVPPPFGTRNVRLVTSGNIFLREGLGLLPELDLTIVAPDNPITDTTTSPALTVFDRTAPDPAALAATTGALWLIAPPAPIPTLGITATATLSQPIPVPANANDPLLAYIDLSEVAILRAQHLELPPWARPVIVDARTNAPLLWVGETGGRQIALLAFDLHESDLVLRVAFPLLLANLTDALVSGPAGRLATQVIPGQPLNLTLPATATGVQLLHPDGRTQTLAPTAGRVGFTPDQLGLYELRWQGNTQLPPLRFAVNLFSPQESNIAPASELVLGRAPTTPNQPTAATSQPLPGQGRQEIWRALAFLALLFLIIEWLVYQRDALTRLWLKLRPPTHRPANR
jgi:Ca-activated chloride channel family protein